MKKIKGFTLIEILLVIAIIGILSSLAGINYQGQMKRSRDGKRKTDLEAIRGALEMMRSDCGDYQTADLPWGAIWQRTCPVGGNTYTYMQKVPQDPQNPTYTYSYSSDGTTYTLCALLESPPAGSSCSGGCCSSCTDEAACNYSVTQP